MSVPFLSFNFFLIFPSVKRMFYFFSASTARLFFLFFFFVSLSLFYIFSKSFLSLPQFKSFWALYSLLLVPQCTAKVDLWENVEIYTGFENEKLKGIFFHACRVKMAVAVKNLQLRFVCVWFRKRDNEARCNLLCKCFCAQISLTFIVWNDKRPSSKGQCSFSL